MEKRYIGIDLHRNRFTCCIRLENERTYVTEWTLESLTKFVKKLRPNDPFRYTCDPPYPYDVQKRVPNVEKAERVLGFRAATPLDEVLDTVIPWVRQQVEFGNI